MWGVLKFFSLIAALTMIPVVVGWFGRDPRPYNPDVFPAFRAIEAHCMSQSFENLTVRCDSVIEFARGCHESEHGCSADEMYEAYDRLMFDLPPLRIEAAR